MRGATERSHHCLLQNEGGAHDRQLVRIGGAAREDRNVVADAR